MLVRINSLGYIAYKLACSIHIHPVVGILGIGFISLGRNVYFLTGNIQCNYIQIYLFCLEVMLDNLDGCNSVSLVVVFVSDFQLVIGNLKHGSDIINKDFLLIRNHLIGGNVRKGHLYDIITIASQRNLGLPIVCLKDLCPSGRNLLIVYFYNRSIGQIKVRFCNSKNYGNIALCVEDVIVFSVLTGFKLIASIHPRCFHIQNNRMLTVDLSFSARHISCSQNNCIPMLCVNNKRMADRSFTIEGNHYVFSTDVISQTCDA